MADWKCEVDETSETKAITAADVPLHWQPSLDTINAIKTQTEGAEGRE